MKLIGRRVELARLEAAWKQARRGVPQLAVVWGRRRVGKTFLAAHFLRGKSGVFFGATEQAESVELARWNEAVQRDLGPQAADLAGGVPRTWEAALRFLAARAAGETLVAILDEVPYLTRSTRGFASVVQTVWDRLQPGTKLLLILIGSSVGTMENLIGGGGALRGRSTLRIRLDPLDILAARNFLPKLGPVPLIEAFAACGGYPLLLRSWDDSETTRTNLLRLALEPGGPLLEEAAGILREELPETGGYPRILAAVGRGRTRYSQIAGEAEQRIEHPLSVLVDSGFLRRATPIGAPRGARPVYELVDPYLAFWFRVLYSDIPSVETGQGRAVFERIQEKWSGHLGGVFEELAREHARRLVDRGELPEDLLIGRWWSVRGEPCEIDVLGLRGNRVALLGEARWRNRPLGRPVLEELSRKSEHVGRTCEDMTFALWGRDGTHPSIGAGESLGFDAGDVVSPD